MSTKYHSCAFFTSAEGSPTQQPCGRQIEEGKKNCVFHEFYLANDRCVAPEKRDELLRESNATDDRLMQLRGLTPAVKEGSPTPSRRIISCTLCGGPAIQRVSHPNGDPVYQCHLHQTHLKYGEAPFVDIMIEPPGTESKQANDQTP